MNGSSTMRVMVKTSPTRAVTRTISALLVSGWTPAGQTVQLNSPSTPGSGKIAPSPTWTSSDRPEAAGTGATATVL
jgi:hypothetical protein